MCNIVDHLGVGVWAQRDETIVFVNASLARLLGYSSNTDMLGRSVREIVHRDAWEELRARMHGDLTRESAPYLTVLSTVSGNAEAVCLFPQTSPDGWMLEQDPASPLFVETVIPLRHFGGLSGLRLDAVHSSACSGCGGDDLKSMSQDLQDSARVAFEQLTRRETEIVDIISSGADLGAVALQLSISPHTVRNHLKAIFRKLGIRSQAELLIRIITRERAQNNRHVG